MSLSTRAFFATVAICAGLIGPSAALAETRELSGTVTYGERITLPAGARITVRLSDVSLADAVAPVLAEAALSPATKLPVRFRLAYDDSNITPGHSYALSAVIMAGDQMLFINDTHHPVFGEGPDATDITVVRVGEVPEVTHPVGNWLAEDIGGRGVLDNAQSVLELAGDGAVSGSGGCNRMISKAAIDGASIRFAELGSTRRACVPAVNDQEAKFFAALMAARKWQVDAQQDKLKLLDGKGRVLVVFSRN
jgi:putative lipoprotein